MTCYHPKIRIEDTTKWEIAADGHRYHPARIVASTDEELLPKAYKFPHKYKTTPIACRNCIGCRLDYATQWADRGYLESKENKECYFITLTYSDKELTTRDEVTTTSGITYTNNGQFMPDLEPKDLQDFIKALRQIARRDDKNNKIRYLACGEYGGKNGRPHYHLIAWMHLPVETMYNPRLLDHHFYYQNKWIERAWHKGISNVTEANWQTVAYVARYITKKINGTDSEDLYAQAGIRKEFLRVSRGLGKAYFENHKDEIYKNDKIYVKRGDKTIATTPPKYFDRLLEKENPEKLKEIKKKRQRLKQDSLHARDKKTSKGITEQLEVMERTAENRGKKLIRGMEAMRDGKG